jgi:hypothetical protein
MSNKSLAVQLQESKKINEILVKEIESIKRFCLYAFGYSSQVNLIARSKIIKELDRLDSVYESEQKMKINILMLNNRYQNRNWSVNKHLDNFLSRFNY